MSDRFHFKLGLSSELWSELLRAALPVALTEGEFDATRDLRAGFKQLQVRERVAGLLEDRKPPETLKRIGRRARTAWQARKPGIYRRLDDLIRVRGTWTVVLDGMGTELTYGQQQVSADAWVKAVAEGTITLLRENVEFPFRIEKRVGASVAIGDVRYDKGHRAVIGDLKDLSVHLGDNVVLQLLSRLAEYGIEQQLGNVNPLPILKRDQVEEMVAPMGGPLRMKMGVEDLELEITEKDLTLKVRFGFTQMQLTDRNADT